MTPNHARFVVPFAAALAIAFTAASARAAEPAPDPLRAGFYAVMCSRIAWGKTKKAAVSACQKATKSDKWVDHRLCNCAKHGAVLEFPKAPEPAFYLAGSYHKGKTPAAATARCKHALAEWNKLQKKKADRDTSDGWECERITSTYGPFDYKADADPYGDPEIYKWLTADGEWVDEDGESPCFTAETQVLTPDGPKRIADFVAGDKVVSWDAETGREVVGRVTLVKPRVADAILTVRLADGRALRVTPNHPLWSASRAAWTPAGELQVGDTLALFGHDALTPVAVVAIDVPEATPSAAAGTPVYDLTVVPTHSYFAGGIWAHNY